MNTFKHFGVKTLLPSPAGFILMQNFVEDCKKVGWKYCEEFTPFSQREFESMKGILYFSNLFCCGGITTDPDTLMSLTRDIFTATPVFTLETHYSEALEHAKKTYQQAMSPIPFMPKMGDCIFLKTKSGYKFIFISSGDEVNPTRAITGYSLCSNSIFTSNRVLDIDRLDKVAEFRYATPAEMGLLDEELYKKGKMYVPSLKTLENIPIYKVGKFYSDVDPFLPSATILQCVGIEDNMVYMKHVAGDKGCYGRTDHPRFGEVIPFPTRVKLIPVGEDL